MLKPMRLMTLCIGLSGGALCSLACNGFSIPWPEVGEVLDQVACTMRIVEKTGQATVTADIFTLVGLPVELRNGQSVQVNGETLLATEDAGRYVATLPVVDTYVVTVTEPTRGVQTTSQPAPADFAIVSPVPGSAASLSGFTLSWSNANAALEVTISMVQMLFGQERRKEVGPSADTGSRVFSAQDLADFRQGAELSITVTKSSKRTSIAGFGSGELTVDRSRTASATPQP